MSSIASFFSKSKANVSSELFYGFAPYFFELLENELKKASFYAARFDEYFNKINQKEQMDLSVRYWNDVFKIVVIRHCSLSLMEKASSNDVLEHFHQNCSKIEEHKIMQVSSGGPNVNLKFFDEIF